MVAHAQDEVARSKMMRFAYGFILVAATIALLVYAARFAFPSGQAGIEEEPAETRPAPAQQAAP